MSAESTKQSEVNLPLATKLKRGSLYFLFFHFKSFALYRRVLLTLRLKHVILPAILFRLFFADQRIILNIKNKYSNLKSYNEIESGRNERYILYANSNHIPISNPHYHG